MFPVCSWWYLLHFRKATWTLWGCKNSPVLNYIPVYPGANTSTPEGKRGFLFPHFSIITDLNDDQVKATWGTERPTGHQQWLQCSAVMMAMNPFQLWRGNKKCREALLYYKNGSKESGTKREDRFLWPWVVFATGFKRVSLSLPLSFPLGRGGAALELRDWYQWSPRAYKLCR